MISFRVVGAMLFVASFGGVWAYRNAVAQVPEVPKQSSHPAWTSSKITGTPERPQPYVAQRVFPNLEFHNPLFMVRAPGVDRWFVGEHRGRIYSFPKDAAVKKADLFADLTQLKTWDPATVKKLGECYALVFHPQFPKKRTCYVCYILESVHRDDQLPEGTRISEFQVTDTDPPTLDLKSERIVLTFLGGGHNGCDMHFGNDGYLYISTGDGSGPNPPDRRDSGQDVGSLLSKILRIDVDKTEPGLQYAIPKDNPFVGLAKARGEVWSYGYRNPWRMSFDRPTGDLWVGDVGWELWEMIYRVQRGGNYGWSIKEGRQDVKPGGKRGPTPILPPTIEFPHTEAASITGGFVYHGKKFPELEGAYVCGDWVTRKVWATKVEKDRIVWHKEIAMTPARIVAFGEDSDGELYIVNYAEKGGLYGFAPNPAAKDWKDAFPRKLSETGLFARTENHVLAPGVQSFAVNVDQWIDGGKATRFFAVPGTDKVKLYDDFIRNDETWGGTYSFFPKDGVLGKTISLEMEHGKPESAKRLETQILHYDGDQWRGYTYVWNDAQTDADLLDSKGRDLSLTVKDKAGDARRQTWHFPSRAECLTCHNPWAGFSLAFVPGQLDGRPGRNQLADLVADGWVDLLTKHKGKDTPLDPAEMTNKHRLATPGLGDPEAYARSYLHVNCSHCHQFGAGGTVDLELRNSVPLSQAKLIDVRPVQGGFDIPDARIIAPGDPMRSALYYRMAKLGRGRMPHIGSDVVDVAGLAYLRNWIQGITPQVAATEAIAKLEEPDDPNLDAKKAKAREIERPKLFDKLLSSTDSALLLADALSRAERKSRFYRDGVQLGLAHANPLIRDLFEQFATPEQRVVRLGTDIDPQKLLSLTGDVDRGRELFFSPLFQCGSCHQVAKKGGQLGPDLSDVARRLSKGQIVEGILTPSKTIEPKYLTHSIETKAGQVHVGLLVDKTAKEMALRVAGDKEVRVPLTDIAATQTLTTSLMPDNLLRDATTAQAGDLLAYLWSLR